MTTEIKINEVQAHFNTKEEYVNMRKAWAEQCKLENKSARPDFADNILYHLLRGTDYKTAISANTEPDKVADVLHEVKFRTANKERFERFSRFGELSYETVEKILEYHKAQGTI